MSGQSGSSVQPEQEKLPSGGERALHLRECSCKGECPGPASLLSSGSIQQYMQALPLWSLSDDHLKISKSFVAKNFTCAIDFFNGVKDVAETEGHHPDLHLTSYRNVCVELSTHAAGGLTSNDMIVAAKIDAVPCVYSPKWLRQQTGEQ